VAEETTTKTKINLVCSKSNSCAGEVSAAQQ